MVTVAEKMQPALPVTAQFAEKARKKKPEAEKAATKHSGERKKSDPLLSFCWTGDDSFCFGVICYFHEICKVCQLGYACSSY